MSIRRIFKTPYGIMACVFAIFILFGLFCGDGIKIFEGLLLIISTPDILISDYIEIGGLGAALINAGFVGLFILLILKLCRHEPRGLTLVSIWMAFGFALFGKNLVNMTPIILGGLLFSRAKREPFSKNVVATIFGTTLAPAVSQMTFMSLPPWTGLALAALTGVVIGFVIEPIAKNALKSHSGYNLYNVGFASGIFAIFIMSFLRNIGVEVAPVNIWSSGNNLILSSLIILICIFLILAGILCSGEWKDAFRNIYMAKSLNVDYFSDSAGACYINMGILGIFCIIFINLMNAQLSGPVIGAVFAVMGYGGYGKNLRNIIPIMAGALLAGFVSTYAHNDSKVIMTVLFATCLAPVSTAFGPVWGAVAGFVHFCIAMNLSVIHGGLSLYNNGLAGGFAVMIIVPIINGFNKRHREPMC